MSKKKYATEVIVHHSASSLFAAKVRDRFITMLTHSSRGTLKGWFPDFDSVGTALAQIDFRNAVTSIV
jgi:hypothetical protein